jgi:MYXO-CTERM domain-containing protein
MRAQMSSFLRMSVLAAVAASATADAAPHQADVDPIIESNVLAGHQTTRGKWPDAVALLENGRGGCTGTLIAPDVVLTAGHCTQVQFDQVKIGAIDSAGTASETIAVEDIIGYPNWSNTYDVGVVILARASTAKPRGVLPSCAVDELTEGAPIQLVGFGATTPDGEDGNTLLNEATVDVADASCSEMDGCKPAVAPAGEFGAGGDNTGSCFGDSGGPAYLTTSSGTFLAGVVSRGVDTPGAQPCGDGGIYVRADAVLDWVREVSGRDIPDATCDGDGDGDDESDDGGESDDGDGGDGGASGSDAVGGCSTTGGSSLAFGLALVALVVSRRRR